MTRQLVHTAAASAVALPNAWDDAEEWAPPAEGSSGRVLPFPNGDIADTSTHAPADTARASTRKEGKAGP